MYAVLFSLSSDVTVLAVHEMSVYPLGTAGADQHSEEGAKGNQLATGNKPCTRPSLHPTVQPPAGTFESECMALRWHVVLQVSVASWAALTQGSMRTLRSWTSWWRSSTRRRYIPDTPGMVVVQQLAFKSCGPNQAVRLVRVWPAEHRHCSEEE